ncbi:hypothetical protein QQ045_001622 [Rhodiola kirilowii]
MDKSWMGLERGDSRYIQGLVDFVESAKQIEEKTHLCPCRKCLLVRGRISTNEIVVHLISNGMMNSYITWTSHGERSFEPSAYQLRQEWLKERYGETSSSATHHQANRTLEILHDQFPFRHIHEEDHMNMNAEDGDSESILAYERQLGQYKKYVRNTRYPKGCIAEQYVAHECVMYCKLYMGEIKDGTADQEEEEPWTYQLHHMSSSQWAEVLKSIVNNFTFWLVSHSVIVATHIAFGLRFVILDKDQHMKTQNSGVMILAGDVKYYRVLQNVIELKYAEGMPIIIFKWKWFNTDPLERNIKTDHGIVSIDTTTTWYDDAPYCLAKHAQQVFYLHDPKLGDNWKVVNVVAQRGTYSDSCISEDGSSNVVEQAYQEDETTNIPHFHMCNEYDGDDDIDEGLETPRTVPALYYDYAVQIGGDAMDVEENEDEFAKEDEEDDDDELEYVSDNYESDDGVDGEEDGDEQEDD